MSISNTLCFWLNFGIKKVICKVAKEIEYRSPLLKA